MFIHQFYYKNIITNKPMFFPLDRNIKNYNTVIINETVNISGRTTKPMSE